MNARGQRVVGVVAVQGAVAAHVAALERAGCTARLVRTPRDLEGIQGLVFPGGESTAQRGLLERAGMWPLLDERVREGMPTLLTCAGLILGCVRALDPDAVGRGWIDVDVRRNGWGRQSMSRAAEPDGGGAPLVLIRAPRIVRVGPRVEVLQTLDGEPVSVRQGNVVGTTHHPELAAGDELHETVFGPGVRVSAGA